MNVRSVLTGRRSVSPSLVVRQAVLGPSSPTRAAWEGGGATSPKQTLPRTTMVVVANGRQAGHSSIPVWHVLLIVILV